MGVKIDRLKCCGCGGCILICPVAVLSIVDMKCEAEEGCISCGKCVDRCLWQAITLVDDKTEDKKD